METVTRTQDFVRYSAGLERDDPNFEQNLGIVLDDLRQHMRDSAATEGRVVRNAHAKGYGLARGEVEILKGVPQAYAQGIYATPGRHEAMVRFSNGNGHGGADRFLGGRLRHRAKALRHRGPDAARG